MDWPARRTRTTPPYLLAIRSLPPPRPPSYTPPLSRPSCWSRRQRCGQVSPPHHSHSALSCHRRMEHLGGWNGAPRWLGWCRRHYRRRASINHELQCQHCAHHSTPRHDAAGAQQGRSTPLHERRNGQTRHDGHRPAPFSAPTALPYMHITKQGRTWWATCIIYCSK